MVQILLTRTAAWARLFALAGLFCVLLVPNVYAAGTKVKKNAPPPDFWELALEGGRKLTWEQSFTSETDVKPNKGFWTKLVDLVAGAPDVHTMVRPFSVATDSHGRVLITDPGASGVHIFDFVQHKYKFVQHVSRDGLGKNEMRMPQCVAVDAADNFYVTDSERGVIFVFNADGKFQRVIGSLKGGEGYFKRPTGIAVDSASNRIYVTDTLRDEVFVLDMQGTVVQRIGATGDQDGQMNLPTELRMDGKNLLVVDAMNFRVQSFDASGKFEYKVGELGDGLGKFFRPKAVGIDSEGDLYVVDSYFGMVQVFNREGQLLYYFGKQGVHAGEFQLPSGLAIDRNDKVYVVDTFNKRVQIFQYVGLKRPVMEAGK